MSENENNTPGDSKLPTDWSSDYFPTSARHVFLGWGAMLVGIIILCFIVYSTSEHSVDENLIKKQENTRARLNELNVTEDE